MEKEIDLLVNSPKMFRNTLESPSFMIGILSKKDCIINPSLETQKCPALTTIPALLEKIDDFEKYMPTIHYSTDTIEFSDEIKRLMNFHKRISDRIKAIQLNLPYPELKEIEKIKKEYPFLKIIFQLKPIYLSLSDLPSYLVQKYSMVDYILYDLSQGHGIAIDIKMASDFYKAFKKVNQRIDIGFAGGLSDKNIVGFMQTMKELLQTNEFSIDAQSSLRTNAKISVLDIERSQNYLANAFILYCSKMQIYHI